MSMASQEHLDKMQLRQNYCNLWHTNLMAPFRSTLHIVALRFGGSKKQITEAFKHLIRLYASYSLEVVSVLVQLLLNGSDSKSYQVSHSTTHVQSLFDDWKPVVKKLSNKEPELLLNLIKAVLEKIETQEAMEYESVNAQDAGHLDH
ncbi:unnamed protein product [Camellia sinensis]